MIRRVHAHQPVSHTIRVINSILRAQDGSQNPRGVDLSFVDALGPHRGSAAFETDSNKARAQVDIDVAAVAPNGIAGVIGYEFIAYDSVRPAEPVDQVVVQPMRARVLEQSARVVLQR